MSKSDELMESFMNDFMERNPHEPEFQQAVREAANDIIPFLATRPKYQKEKIFERLTEPDRIITFRVCWEDDQGGVQVNRGYRVQHNNAIGPYKGGLRFHPSVNHSVLKFLAFEQTFKNSLTGLPLGAGKGGSDFDPKGKSDREVQRFCQSFMTELCRHIGPETDVPAGDIGVGPREIGYLFGQYKRLENTFSGSMTGKGLEFGGSLVRTEATGYGAVFMMQNMLARNNDDIMGKTCVVSGSGNVSLYAAEKILQFGGKVITLSDSNGSIYDKDGIDKEKLAWVHELKSVRRGRIQEYVNEYPRAEYYEGKRPWDIPCDLAFPCATENEINEEDARQLIKNGCIGVSEGANMPSDQAAVDVFIEARTLFAPGKAANAGGVAVSGLEMSQNSARMSWKEAQLLDALSEIMSSIHEQCVVYGEQKDGTVNYVKGANLAAFTKVADAMLAYGIV